MTSGFEIWEYDVKCDKGRFVSVGKPKYGSMKLRFIGHGETEEKAVKDMKCQQYLKTPKLTHHKI